MANNWAIAIGINTYEHLPQTANLSYAAKDAVLLRDFLAQTAGFPAGQILLCTDDSAPVGNLSTRPTRSNLRKLLREELPRAKGADNLCFYFSGHGMAGTQGDYFLPADGNPNDLHDTAVAVQFVTECLRKCQAKNVVLILDMCRNEGRDENAKAIGNTVGQQIIAIAKQQGLVTMFSCERGQRSYEIPALGYGAFTYSLVNGLKQHNVLRQLEQYLFQTVGNLRRDHGCEVPLPKLIAEPPAKYDLPLLMGYVAQDRVDVAQLTQQAITAELHEEFETARQLWRQVIKHGSDADEHNAWQALDRIRAKELRYSRIVVPNPPQPPPQSAPSPTASVAQPDVKAATPAQPTVQPTPPPEKPLPERYRALETYLKNGEWKKADNETYRLMITKVGKKEGNWFTKDELLKFDCEELLTIDALWVKYSNGKFGFSVQKELYVECGGILDGQYHGEAWDQFCHKNDWKENGEYVSIKFDIESPKAHLPRWGFGGCRGGGSLLFAFSSLASRLVKCKVADF
ncbi:MAG: GUN4 domain-containing protein [Leptolyngbyaceae bacterium]|nr:GUN4 domain-containing protein [Leptolyngbyaceae bacterium]